MRLPLVTDTVSLPLDASNEKVAVITPVEVLFDSTVKVPELVTYASSPIVYDVVTVEVPML